MSAAIKSGRVGRPAGTDPETLARGRDFLMLADYGVPIDAIVRRSGFSRSFVYYAMNATRQAIQGIACDAARQPIGRPKGLSPETLERRRRVQDLRQAGLSVAMIAQAENCTDSYVRLLLKAEPAQAIKPARAVACEPIAGVPRNSFPGSYAPLGGDG